MKTLYLVYRWFDQDRFERCTDDGWKLIGIIKDSDLIEQIEEADRKQFGEDAHKYNSIGKSICTAEYGISCDKTKSGYVIKFVENKK